jgi:hypothetical protein
MKNDEVACPGHWAFVDRYWIFWLESEAYGRLVVYLFGTGLLAGSGAVNAGRTGEPIDFQDGGAVFRGDILLVCTPAGRTGSCRHAMWCAMLVQILRSWKDHNIKERRPVSIIRK